MQGKNSEWFKDWFNSPYYHVLYKHRDEEEAKEFIDNLSRYLGFSQGEKVLDLACGRGRFSVFLNNKGLDVTGVDIAPENISFASKFSNSRLKFEVHDMREKFAESAFKYILNLFTSFGYFNSEEEDIKVLRAAYAALENKGIMVLDFMNADKIIAGLVSEELKKLEGIEFRINRRFEDGFIIKEISFEDKGEAFRFYEKVRAIRKEDFERFFKLAGFDLMTVLGNYRLEPFHPQSERMIFIARKA